MHNKVINCTIPIAFGAYSWYDSAVLKIRMRIFDYSHITDKLRSNEVCNLISAIHEFRSADTGSIPKM